MPHGEHRPAATPQQAGYFLVACLVVIGLGVPEASVRFRRLAFLAAMTMPEAPVDKKYLLPCTKYEIGFAGQVGSVKRKAIPAPVQGLPDFQFRHCVFRFHSSHDLAARLLIYMIHLINIEPHAQQKRPEIALRPLSLAGRLPPE